MLPIDVLRKIMTLGTYFNLLTWRLVSRRCYMLAKSLPGTFPHNYTYSWIKKFSIKCRRTALGLLDGVYRKFEVRGDSGKMVCEHHFVNGVSVGRSFKRIDIGLWQTIDYKHGRVKTITWYDYGHITRIVNLDKEQQRHGRLLVWDFDERCYYEDTYVHGRRQILRRWLGHNLDEKSQ